MAKPKEVLAFVIDSFTPDTLPMARLGEYLIQLSALLGHKERVHFRKVDRGSATLVHEVESTAFPKVRDRVHNVKLSEGPADALKAFQSLDAMLREDNASGQLRRLGLHRARLLQFPGASRQLDDPYGPFSEPGELQGIPVSVGGRTQWVNVNLLDGDAQYFCEATRELALEIAPLLFYQPIRVFGVGKYCRMADGIWEMKSFRISHFELLERRTFRETVERLRLITKKTELGKDVLDRLTKVRGA